MAGLGRWVSVLSCFSRFSLLFSLLLYSSYFGLWRLVGLGRWSPSLVFLCCILVVVFLTVVLLAFCASEVGWVGKVVSFSFSFCVVFLAVVFLIVVLLAFNHRRLAGLGWWSPSCLFSTSCCFFLFSTCCCIIFYCCIIIL